MDELGDPQGRAAALALLAALEHDEGRPVEARWLLGEVIAAYEQLGDRRGHAVAQLHLAAIELEQGDPTKACRLIVETLSTLEQLGDLRGHAAALHQLGIVEQTNGNIAEARGHYDKSIGIKQAIQDLEGIASTRGMLAELQFTEGRFDEAVAQMQESIRLFEMIGLSKVAKAQENLKTIEAKAELDDPETSTYADLIGKLMGKPPAEALLSIEQALEARSGDPVGLQVILLCARASKRWQQGEIQKCDQVLADAGRALERVDPISARRLNDGWHK